MLAQGLKHGRSVGGANLDHHAQLFVEQGFECEFFAACADLASPVLGVAMVGTAVCDAIAFGHQHVHIERHAHMPCKGHLGHGSQQAAIAAVVVGQNLALCAHGVDGVHQMDQVLRLIQIGHLVTKLAQHLAEHAAAHAVFALAQVDQQQAGVVCLRIQLRGQGAAHIRQAGKGRDDQADGRCHLAGFDLRA